MTLAQQATIDRIRLLGYAVHFERMQPSGVVEVSAPGKLNGDRLRLMIRRNGDYAPRGHWANRRHVQERYSWQTLK